MSGARSARWPRRRTSRGWPLSPARRWRPAPSASARLAPATTAAPTVSTPPRSPPTPMSCSGSLAGSAPPARACSRRCPTSTTSMPSSRLFRSMAEASGRPLSFSLAGVDPAKYPRQLELLDEANAAGRADAGPGRRPRHRRPRGLAVHDQPAGRQPGVAGDRRPVRGRAGSRHGRAELQGAVPGRRQAAGRCRPDVRAGRPARLRTRSVDQHRGPCRPRGPRTHRPRLRPVREGRGPHVPLRPDHQLVRRHP